MRWTRVVALLEVAILPCWVGSMGARGGTPSVSFSERKRGTKANELELAGQTGCSAVLPNQTCTRAETTQTRYCRNLHRVGISYRALSDSLVAAGVLCRRDKTRNKAGVMCLSQLVYKMAAGRRTTALGDAEKGRGKKEEMASGRRWMDQGAKWNRWWRGTHPFSGHADGHGDRG
ncbi:hypothetical protein LZ31DRAFT_102561 [Colletotrichum somersetense]|nr:hypothetical protein LZ31DRAFT_102561 [Colletotrichum somersetense]